jgi:hypothetical protein
MSRLLVILWRCPPNRIIVALSLSQTKGATPMFVRAVWRVWRPIGNRKTFRSTDVPTARDGQPLGLAAPDFIRMTKSLFDR